MSVKLDYRRPGPYASAAYEEALTTEYVIRRLSITLAKIVFAPAALIGLMALFFLLVGYLSPLLVFMLVMSGLIVIRTIRGRRGATVLSYVNQAIRLNLPLPRMLRAAAETEKGKVRQRLRALCEVAESCAAVGLALEISVPEIPRRKLRLIQAAEHLGRLPITLSRLVDENRKERQEDPIGKIFLSTYLFTLLALFIPALVIPFFGRGFSPLLPWLTIVGPKYEKIMQDFRLPLPPASHYLFWAFSNLGPAIGLIAAVFAALYFGLKLWEIFWPGRDARKLTQVLTDRLIWLSPFVGKLARDRGFADVFQVMSDALEIGHPADRALIEVGELRLNSVLRDRVTWWHDGLDRGLSLADAARAARMPALAVGMLSSAAATESSAEVCQFLARYYGGRYDRNADLLRAAILPSLAILFGLIVCWAALAVFMPMMRMVDVLSFPARRM